MNKIFVLWTMCGLLLSCSDEPFILPFEYDFYEGARDVTSLINVPCTGDPNFNTGASADRNAGSCSELPKPLYNSWFKFKAPVTQTIVIDLIDQDITFGITKPIITLWEADGLTERQCIKYVNPNENISLADDTLTAGKWYYISIDAQCSTCYGRFLLCLRDSN